MAESLNVLQRLNKVRATLSYIQKDQKKIDGQYTATRYDDIVEHAHDLLVAEGILVVVETLPVWDVVVTDQKTKSGATYTRWQGIIQTTFYNIDDPKDFVVSSAPAFGLDQGDKGPGKAHTYGAKSNLIKTLFLVTGDESEEKRAESNGGDAMVASIGKKSLDNFCASIKAAQTEDEIGAAWQLANKFIKQNGDNKEDRKVITDAGKARKREILDKAKAKS